MTITELENWDNWIIKIKIESKSEKQGPSGVALEMFKVGGDKCLEFLTIIFNDILFRDKFLEEWMLSLLVPIFKEKEDPLNPNCYMAIKLLGHAFKLYEKICSIKCSMSLC